MKITQILFCLSILLTGPITKSSTAAERMRLLQRGDLIVQYDEGDEGNAAQVLDVLDEAYTRLASDIGLEATPTIEVILAASEEHFNNLTRGELPHWAQGAALSGLDRAIIVLRSPRWDNTNGDFKGTVVHEMIHVFFATAVDYHPIPRWLNEGLAIYYSGERQWVSASQVSKALLTNSIIPLEDIEEVNTYNEHRAQLAYQESHLAVRYLIETFGWQAIKSIASGLRREMDIDDLFYEAIGLEFWEFERDWMAYIKRRYRWTFFADIESYLWVGILILMAGAFLAVQHRKRKTLKRWEEEDLSGECEQSN